MTYAFTREISPSPPPSSYPPPASSSKFQHWGPNPRLKAPKFQPWGPNFSPKAQIPASYTRLKAKIPASRLKYQPGGSNSSPKAPNPASRPQSQPWGSNENSIGCLPLLGRCPSNHLTPTYTHTGATGTADHLTLLRLFVLIRDVEAIDHFHFGGWDSH